MLEHMFRPNDRRWARRCASLYRCAEPLILISGWNERVIREQYGRTGPLHQVGNGINLVDFPIEPLRKDGHTVLVEGWNPGINPTKDATRIAARVAARLRKDGCRIIAYGLKPPLHHQEVPHEYHVQPDLSALNDLYRRATILVKASRYDARACAPIEAMTKGTVTARAIIEGDDDLTAENSLRVAYDERALYAAARMLLDDDALRSKLASRCLAYAQENTWEAWMPRIEALLCASAS
jgi:glycosyltransferase involved in cell wall biosynthesis